MISISLFVHPDRRKNLYSIHEYYKDCKSVNEVLIVTGKEIDTTNFHSKFKFVHMPGPYTYGAWPSFGLLSRYTFALHCKNNHVLIQDDDCIYPEDTIENMYSLNEPCTGVHRRWFTNQTYTKSPPFKGAKTAPIILTSGFLTRREYIPDVIKYANSFWADYNNVFNGEDIFLSRAISKIANQDEFKFVKKPVIKLPKHNVQLHNRINKEGSRTEICKKIYNFFDGFS